MRSVKCGVVIIAVALLAAGESSLGQEKPKSATQEWERFQKACESFNSGAMDAACSALNDFLRDFPKSALAPEAAFKLSAAYGLQGKGAESAQARERLVRDYMNSPWTFYILCTQYDEKQLLGLANERRLKGINEQSNADITAALCIYKVCLDRCNQRANQSPMAKNEVQNTGKEALYRVGDCLYSLGQEEPFKAIMHQVQAADGDGQWGKLAATRLGDAHAFQERMDELLNLHTADNEELRVFLELADKHAAALDADAQVKCLYYRARCHLGLQEIDKALPLCRQVIDKHPKSPWAAEATMYLAEHHFSKGDAAKAKAMYKELAQKYPDSPRAAQARAWVGWLDHADKNWKEVEDLLADLAQKGNAGKGAFSLRVSRQSGGGGKTLEGRVAFQDAQHYLLSLTIGPAAFLLAKNKDGSWFRLTDRPEVIKTKKGADVPLPQIVAQDDGQLSFKWGFGDQALPQTGPPVQIAPKAAAAFAGRWKTTFHLSKEHAPATKGYNLYRLQQPTWEHQQVTDIEIELDATKKIQEIRITLYNDKAEKFVWVISDLCVGGPLPEKVLNPELAPGLAVHEVEELNPMEIFSGVMRLFSLAMEAAGANAKKK
jgi:outer membrane protein assembly factor BamD (BamD/ComL family)